ncbi:MAG: hypothetical protein PHG82_03170 [Candidatus Gracilibacteria bacterium]|nr:hypothetical protein [Candidatus Gracilibacteria bacterium]
MSYYIKLHYLSNEDYEGKDELSDAYNETLELLGKEKEVFYDEIKNEYIEEFSKEWIDYERNGRYEEFFEYDSSREVGLHYYDIVKVNFIDINEDEIDEFQEKFLSLLKDKVDFIYKFEDNRFLEIRKQFFEDIYKIEINLREVVSYIFFTTYYYIGDFLKDLEVDDVTKKYNLKFEDLKDNFENEFFYISFNDYKKLLNLKKLKEEEKTELMKDSDSFDDWKRRIFERGIKDEPYIDFIESIKQDLEKLENFRNAIMHNHSFTQNLKHNYEKSKEEILRKIEDFRSTHLNNSGNDLGLIPGKKYKYIGSTTDNFINGKKYKLVELYGSDSIFEGEIEKNSIPYWDKEFHEYWSE